MALSFINTCYYPNCGLNFNSQHHLLIHIENAHVDFDPKAIEEVEKTRFQHVMVPPSYVLKYNLNNDFFPCDISIKEEMLEDESRLSSEHSFPNSYESMFGFNPDGVVVKIEPLNLNKLEYQGLNIDDSYKKTKLNKSAVLSQGGKKRKIPPICDNTRKFACPVLGCNKKYKNINGARYHTKHCHDSFGNTIKPRKDYHCACGKQYKTAAGLRSHLQVYSDKNHGVIITNIINPSDNNNNNKNMLMPRPIMCPTNGCSHAIDSCQMSMPSTCQGIPSDSIGDRGFWHLKGDYCNSNIMYDEGMNLYNRGGAIGMPDNCQIKCEQAQYPFETKKYL